MLRALTFCFAALIAAHAFANDPQRSLQLVQSCHRDVDRDARGIVELEKECPGLRTALDDLDLTARLHERWERTIDRAALGALISLELRYTAATYPTLQKDSLKTVLSELKIENTSEQSSRWERFKSWLRKALYSNPKEAPEWLQRFLENFTISDAVMHGVVYSLVILVVGFAIGVIVVELRAAAVFGVKERTEANGSANAFADRKSSRLSVADLDAAVLRDRPAILLRLLVQRLVELRWLHAERSLTHRELSRQVRFQRPIDRERFERLATLAERMRFGLRDEHEEHDQRTSGVLDEGRVLFKDLEPDRTS